MQIYCFDLDGTPEWPSGTAVAARDRRTSTSVLLYRSLDSEPTPRDRLHPPPPPNAAPPQPPARQNQGATEQRRRARAVFAESASKSPPAPATSTYPDGPRVELFSCRNFLLIAAPDAATAAPFLAELRAIGLFHDPRPLLCSRCHQPSPATPNGLCQACTQLAQKQEILAARKKQAELDRAKRHRTRALLASSLLIALAVPLYVWWPSLTRQPPPAPAIVPIVQFTASPQTVKRGARVLLSWSTSGLSNLSIAPGIGMVPSSGKRSVVIERDTTFTLRAPGLTPASVTVAVIGSSPGSTLKLPSGYTPSAPPQTSPETSATAAHAIPSEQNTPDSAAAFSIGTVLQSWAAAYRTNDPRRQAALYAPQVERFFLRQNVDSAFVESYMTDFYARGTRFTSFYVTDPAINFVDAGNAHVEFVKNYTLQLAGGATRNVVCRSELHLIRTASGIWRINFERDFKGDLRYGQSWR